MRCDIISLFGVLWRAGEEADGGEDRRLQHQPVRGGGEVQEPDQAQE